MAVHPDAVMVTPGVVAVHPDIANRPPIIVRSVDVIWPVTYCHRHSHCSVRRGYNGRGTK